MFRVCRRGLGFVLLGLCHGRWSSFTARSADGTWGWLSGREGCLLVSGLQHGFKLLHSELSIRLGKVIYAMETLPFAA